MESYRPKSIALGFALTVAVCSFVRPLHAQEPKADDPLDAIRTLSSFGGTEDRAIDQWISAKLDELQQGLKDDDPEVSGAASTAFRTAVSSQVKNTKSSPRFLQRFAERLARAATPLLQPDTDKAVARAVAFGLRLTGRVAVRDALAVGLKHNDQGVRFTCAITFATLVNDLSADAATAGSVIRVLAEAGKSEHNGGIIEALFQALSYESNRFLGDTCDAMAQIIKARVQRRLDGQDLRVDRAELTALYYLQKVQSNIPQANRPVLVSALAGMLALDVARYPQASARELRDLQERIYSCEDLLGSMVNGGGGNIRAKMAAGGDVMVEEMGLELLKWVGGSGQQGVLNQNPWNVPPGGLPK